MTMREFLCKVFHCYEGTKKAEVAELRNELKDKLDQQRTVAREQRRKANEVEHGLRGGVLGEPLRLAGEILSMINGGDKDTHERNGR